MSNWFNQEEMRVKAKPFDISKHQVMQAYRLVKANAGAAGVDHQSLRDFEEDLKNNLYRLCVLVKQSHQEIPDTERYKKVSVSSRLV